MQDPTNEKYIPPPQYPLELIKRLIETRYSTAEEALAEWKYPFICIPCNYMYPMGSSGVTMLNSKIARYQLHKYTFKEKVYFSYKEIDPRDEKTDYFSWQHGQTHG